MTRAGGAVATVAGGVTVALLMGCTPSTDIGSDPTSVPAPDRTTARPSDRATATPAPEPVRAIPGRLRYDYYALDGDTIRRGSRDVRVIGIDTPESGECGFEQARSVTARFVARGVRLANRSGRDQYGRLLAYVESGDGRDLGTLLIRRGLANARYDGTDGYDWHPHQQRYRSLDRRTRHICGARPDSLGGPEPYVGSGPFPDCDAAQSAGAAPLRRGDSGWNPDLDGDDDGVACE